MPALPALTKTWRFRVNQAVAGGGTTLATAQALMFAIKDSLIGNGAWTDSAGAGAAAAGNWTVVASSNGAAVGVDLWAAAANLVWANAGIAHSWIVVEQVALGLQLLIDLTNVNPYNAFISVSVAGFTGGTIQNRPTATDEVILCNTSTWGGYNGTNASTLHVFNATDGTCSRVFICRGGFVVASWCVDKVANPATGWSEQFVAWVVGNSGSATTETLYVSLGNATIVNVFTRRGSYSVQALLGSEWSRNLGNYPGASFVNDMGGGYYIADMNAYSEMPNTKGWLGKMVDQWWTLASTADSDTFPAGGGRNFCVFGDTLQPWNTTAPTFGGGVSTARDGEYLEMPYYEAQYETPVFASPYVAGGGASTVDFPNAAPAAGSSGVKPLGWQYSLAPREIR